LSVGKNMCKAKIPTNKNDKLEKIYFNIFFLV
jgi:hypothetical protein